MNNYLTINNMFDMNWSMFNGTVNNLHFRIIFFDFYYEILTVFELTVLKFFNIY